MSAPAGKVIIVSDRCSRGLEEDKSGPLLQAGLAEAGIQVPSVDVVPDQVSRIHQAAAEALESGARIVLIAGGTGIAPQDVTADAVSPLIAIPLPGLTQMLFQASLEQTPYAALSRAEAGLSESAPRSLIVTLAGSPNAATTTLQCLTPLLSHIFEQLDRDTSSEGAYVAH